MSRKVHLTVRVDEELLKEYKKWLIDRGYKSINQHLNEVIRKALEEDDRIPPSSKEGSILRRGL